MRFPATLVAISLATSATLAAQGQTTGGLTLRSAVDRAQRESFPARAALSSRDAARSRDRAFNAGLLPQFSLVGDLPVYNRSIVAVVQPDGSTLYRAQQQNRNSLRLRTSQRLPWTGGDLFVESALERLERIGEQTSKNWSSTPFSIGLSQPLLRPNSIAWDQRERDLSIQASERQYLEAREDLAIATANAFFDHYSARISLENARSNSAVNDTLYTLNKGRFEVGKIGENDLLQSELALLRSRNALSAAQLDFDRTAAALRLQLNLPSDAPIAFAPLDAIPDVKADTAIAVAQALKNRSQMTQQELNEVQARRRVNEAKRNSGFGASLEASVGYNQSAPLLDAAYRDLQSAQRVAVSVTTPIFTWGQRGSQIQAARADEERVEANRRFAREQLIQEAHFGALQMGLAQGQLEVSAKADTVANKRFEVAKNRYVIGRIGMDNLYLAQNEKDQALQSYLQSLRAYWLAYYRLRRATLYDFETQQRIY